jgi:hypothetical protein
MTLSWDDTNELDRYAEIAGRFEKSTAGPMIDRNIFQSDGAHNGTGWSKYDKDGNVITVGLGWSEFNDRGEEITANPTGGVTIDAKGDPGDDIALLGRVRTKLRAVGPRLADAILAVYGDEGAQAAQSKHVHGSLSCLHRLTRAGRALRKLERALDRKKKIEQSKRDVDAKSEALTNAQRDAFDAAIALKEKAEAAYTRAGYDAQEAKRSTRPYPAPRQPFRDEDM